MKIAFWIWTAFCVIVLGLLIYFAFPPINHMGSSITFTTDDRHQLTINAEEVTIEIASGDFFALSNPDKGETVVGVPRQKPLGWSENNYYKAESTQIQGGLWLVEKGSNVTIHLTSTGTMTVQETLKDTQKSILVLLFVILVGFVWAVGCVIGSID